jgi:sphingosine kinase
MYTVKDNEQEKAIQFCQTIMDSVYKGIKKNYVQKAVICHSSPLFFFLIDLIAEKRLKILVNPFGGQSKAKDILELKVKPIFEAAKCKLDIQCKNIRYSYFFRY